MKTILRHIRPSGSRHAKSAANRQRRFAVLKKIWEIIEKPDVTIFELC